MITAEKAYDEIIDLFARGPTPTAILGFRPSEQSQERARLLLHKLKSGELTEEEAAELERLGQLEHLMQLVKARARRYQDSRS